jgi:hypothetical protein
MMAERFCTLDGHPETATADLRLVLRRSQGRQYNRHAIRFRPGSAEPLRDIEEAVCPVSNTPVLPPAINTPWMSSASDCCRSKRVSVSRNDGW